MNFVVIESPYAATETRSVRFHVDYARRAMRHSLDHGEAPFASHLLYTQPHVLDDSVPRERVRGIQAGYEALVRADLVAFYVDYGWSSGMIMALKFARTLHKKIEVRTFLKLMQERELPSDVGGLLLDAGIAGELDSPISGARAFRFKENPK
jgi:hypothetical protein